jgi:uncharacterized protein YaaW (UPF0174 family)
VPTTEYRNPWYTDENRAKDLNENMKLQLTKVNKIRKQNELNKKIVYDFIKLFNNLNNREPMESEIIDNLKEKINVDAIKKILDENRSISVKINTDDSMTSLFNMV